MGVTPTTLQYSPINTLTSILKRTRRVGEVRVPRVHYQRDILRVEAVFRKEGGMHRPSSRVVVDPGAFGRRFPLQEDNRRD